jgi:signal transduction histidine kinase
VKVRVLPELLPSPLEWRWTRAFSLLGFLFIVAAVVARITRRVPEAPMAYTSAGLMFFALGFWMRSNHLAKLLRNSVARGEKAEQLAIIGRTTAGFAHELKNSVMVVQGLAELAQRNATPPNEEQLAVLNRQATQMLGDLQSFLALTQGESTVRRAVPLSEAIESVSPLLRPLARQRELTIDIAVEPGLSRAVAEPGFRQALLNLGLNAIEHARSHVRITAVTERATIRIAVENDGPTISASEADHVFEPFVSSKPGGFGLGLAQVKAAAEFEAGTANCEPLPEGGTRFVLELPRTSVLDAVPAPQSA